jgi:hypothetical protein
MSKMCKIEIVVKPAIKYLQHRLQNGATCIISTGCYEEGAVGFIIKLHSKLKGDKK